jgi:hypothetical protein
LFILLPFPITPLTRVRYKEGRNGTWAIHGRGKRGKWEEGGGKEKEEGWREG